MKSRQHETRSINSGSTGGSVSTNTEEDTRVDTEEETHIDMAGFRGKKVLESYKDIYYLAYYHPETEQYIESLEELKEMIGINKIDPADLAGIPEELIWVAYKQQHTDEIGLEPYIELVLVGQRNMLKQWMEKRKKSGTKRCKSYPSFDVEQHACDVITSLYDKQSKKHVARAQKLQDRWETEERVPARTTN